MKCCEDIYKHVSGGGSCWSYARCDGWTRYGTVTSEMLVQGSNGTEDATP